jgi:hypothetical protein
MTIEEFRRFERTTSIKRTEHHTITEMSAKADRRRAQKSTMDLAIWRSEIDRRGAALYGLA